MYIFVSGGKMEEIHKTSPSFPDIYKTFTGIQAKGLHDPGKSGRHNYTATSSAQDPVA